MGVGGKGGITILARELGGKRTVFTKKLVLDFELFKYMQR